MRLADAFQKLGRRPSATAFFESSQATGTAWRSAKDGRGHAHALGARARRAIPEVVDGRPDDRADGKTWHFKAQGYATSGGRPITGTWFDSRGISLPLAGRVEGDTMTIDWGTDAIERGRSSYRLAEGTLEVTDEVYTKEGELHVFGRTHLRRVKGDATLLTGTGSRQQR